MPFESSDPSSAEFVPVSMLKRPDTPLETVNASLLVEAIDGTDLIALTFRGFAEKSGYQARVAMSRATWREFCQQWIDLIPKGGKE